jgi:hypothetical protein
LVLRLVCLGDRQRDCPGKPVEAAAVVHARDDAAQQHSDYQPD